jgi:hypothetical protein
MYSVSKKPAVASVFSLYTTVSALAGSVTQPGETVGVAAGAPLPQSLSGKFRFTMKGLSTDGA